MAGLRESLDLSIDQALRQVDRLEARLKQATSGASVAPGRVAPAAAPGAPAVAAGGGGALGGLASAFAAQQVFRTLTTAIGSTVSAASDLNEQISASTIVFGSAAPKIQAFADGAASIGLAKDEALAAANNFGSLFTALDIAQEKAAELGPTLIQRAADLASFRNVSGGTTEVIQRLSSGIVGETEPLRRLGIVINETTVKTKAMELGFVDANGEVSEAGKVQARIALILEQSSVAAGDFARTSDGLANSQRQLAAEFRNVQIEVGTRLLPVVLEGTKGLGSMLGIFTALPGPIQTTVVALAGLATAAVGIGLAALAVQRLSGALLQAGAAGVVASKALRGLGHVGAIVAGVTALYAALTALDKVINGVDASVKDLARDTDTALLARFDALTNGPGPSRVLPTPLEMGSRETRGFAEFEDQSRQLRALAEEGEAGLGVVIRLRDALQAQGTNLGWLNDLIEKETEAQKRANATADAGAAALGTLGLTTAETAARMSELDKALQATSDQMDASFGRFLAADEAAASLSGSVFKLGEEFGKGAEKGESLLAFNSRIGDSLLGVVGKIETYVEAQARAGKIGADAASQQAEIRRQLLLLGDAFPELQSQIGTYLDLLVQVPPKVTTTAVWDDREARTGIGSFIADVRNAIDLVNSLARADPKTGEHMQNVATGVILPPIARAGRDAGRAAADAVLDEIPKSLRRSGASGFDIGGFLIEGINLGPALDKVLAGNWLLADATGKIQEVIEAAKFDPSEMLAVLNAVAKVDQAVLDLNEAIKVYGADSLEAAIATQTLATARADLNAEILDGIDATEAINKLLEDEKKKIDDLTASVNATSGALSALRRIEDARDAARKAAKEASKEEGRLGQFDQRIAETNAELARIRAAGGAGGLDEARALATLRDLEARRVGQVEKTTDAQNDLVDANLAVVDATLSLANAGSELLTRLPDWQAFFVGVAQSAGLTNASIWTLVASLETASTTAARVRTLVAGAATPGTLMFAQGATGSSGGGFSVGEINVYETDSARGTALEIVDELRAVSLLGAG